MGAFLPNLEPLIAAGIDPKTGLPRKVTASCKCHLKDDIKIALRIIDEQQACVRYKWKGIPLNITSQELERMIYYRFQLALFRLEGKYYIMPYVLDGTIDYFGRFKTIHPIPFSNTDDKVTKLQKKELEKIKLEVIYSVDQIDENTIPDNCCVLIHDYTKQMSQNGIPRASINDPILDTMAECIPFMRTRLVLGTGVKGIRVNDADQQESVSEGAKRLENAALNGEAYIPVVGTLDFQDLSSSSAGRSEEYMLAMQSLDNFRLSTYGITNGGLFEKKAHELQSESDMSANTSSLVLTDGLEIRNNSCEIANKLFGINMSVTTQEQEEAKQLQQEQQEDMEGEIEDANYDDSTI